MPCGAKIIVIELTKPGKLWTNSSQRQNNSIYQRKASVRTCVLNSMNMSQRAQFIFLLNYKLNVPLFKVKLLTHVCIYIALSTMWPIADPILNRYQPGYVNSSSHCWCYCYTFCLKTLNRSCRCLVCLKHVEMGHIIRNHILLIFWDNGVDERTWMKNITYSSTWQRLSFLSSLPLQLYSMISPSSYFLLQLPHQVQSEILVLFLMTS